MLPKARIAAFLLLFSATLTSSFVVDVKASPTTWVVETVDASADVGYFSSIAVDSDGFPHMAYYDSHWEDLKYATPSRVAGPDWVISPVDTVGEVGKMPSIALDSSGSPHISYYGFDHLKYAEYTAPTWAVETVYSTGYWASCSLVLDFNEDPRISYYDSSNGDLKYASWAGTVWFIETVDSTGDVGFYNSLAVDSNGISHISYWDQTNAHLKYAYWTGTTWFTETVDASTLVGEYNSIALDSEDKPHISYYDGLNGNLKYAKWTGTAWSIETVDASANVGSGASLALDWLDRPHIAYYDSYWRNLKYARWLGEAWNIEVVDHVGDVGWMPSLALDFEDKPHISYYDETAGNLKYAANPNEYFAGVNVTPFDSDGDGHDDAVEIQMNVDTIDVHGAYSGTVFVQVYAFLVDPFGYHADFNSTGWEITGRLVDWRYIYLYVPPSYFDGPSMYNVELTLFDGDDFFEDFHYEPDIYLYPPRIPWDITGPTMWVPDGKCDMRDVALAAKLYGSIEGDGKYDVRADITGPTYLVPDGKIDMRDVALVAKHYGEIYV